MRLEMKQKLRIEHCNYQPWARVCVMSKSDWRQFWEKCNWSNVIPINFVLVSVHLKLNLIKQNLTRHFLFRFSLKKVWMFWLNEHMLLARLSRLLTMVMELGITWDIPGVYMAWEIYWSLCNWEFLEFM